MKSRGFSIIEALITVVIIALLLGTVSAVMGAVLHAQSMGAVRAGANRSAAELSDRLAQEARSSTAVFLPSADVLGQTNDPAAAHEIDFFRRTSDGDDDFVAYLFDGASHAVTRYEYAMPAGGGAPAVLHFDPIASGIAELSAHRVPVDSLSVVGASDAPQVKISYGYAGVTGGNDVVVASFSSLGAEGVSARAFSLHLSPKIAPTNMAILVAPASATTPAPGGMPMKILLSRASDRGTPPPKQKMWNCDPGLTSGDPCELNATPIPNSSADLSAETSTSYSADGTISFSEPFDGDWNNFARQHPSVQSGSYSYVDDSGATLTVTFSCVSTCPPFTPLPVADTSAPAGGVTFQGN